MRRDTFLIFLDCY